MEVREPGDRPLPEEHERGHDDAPHGVHRGLHQEPDRRAQIIHPKGDVLHLRGMGQGQVPQPGREQPPGGYP